MLAGVLVLCLLGVVGCMSEETKRQWAEAWADFRGDNMELGSHDSPNGKSTP
jgi:hypothetical protein